MQKLIFPLRTHHLFPIAFILALLFLIPAIVFADIIQNDITINNPNNNITLDATGHGSTVVTYSVLVNGSLNPPNDTNGCDVNNGTPLTFHLSVPVGVTASQTSLSPTSCGNGGAIPVTFSATKNGDFPITVINIQDTGPNDLYANNANFTLH